MRIRKADFETESEYIEALVKSRKIKIRDSVLYAYKVNIANKTGKDIEDITDAQATATFVKSLMPKDKREGKDYLHGLNEALHKISMSPSYLKYTTNDEYRAIFNNQLGDVKRELMQDLRIYFQDEINTMTYTKKIKHGKHKGEENTYIRQYVKGKNGKFVKEDLQLEYKKTGTTPKGMHYVKWKGTYSWGSSKFYYIQFKSGPSGSSGEWVFCQTEEIAEEVINEN